ADLESQQCKPVLYPIQRYEVAGPGHRLLAAEITLGAEQAERIESADDQLALGTDDAIHFAEQLMRLVGEFQRVRKHDQIEAVFAKRKPMRVGQNLRRLLEVDGAAGRDARGPQKRSFRQSDLQCVIAEDVGQRRVEISLLASQ